MKILHRYLLLSIIFPVGLVLAVLLTLGALVKLVAQLDDLGVGGYHLLDAFFLVLLQMPTIIAQVLPIATLLGALLGLGTLAGRSELIVLRAAGLSPWSLAGSVLGTGLLLGLLTLALSLYAAPPLERYARQQRELAKFGQAGVSAGKSTWIRDQRNILNVLPPSEEYPQGTVLAFRFDDQGGLEALGRADSVRANPDGQWFVNNYSETRFTPTLIYQQKFSKRLLLEDVNPELLGLTVVREDTMTGPALWRYREYLQRSGLEARRYEVAFWSRLSAVVAVPLMCVLAMPFVLGPLRSGGAGARLLAGLGIGLAWFLLSRTLSDGGEVWHLNTLAIAWLPTCLLALLTLGAVARTR